MSPMKFVVGSAADIAAEQRKRQRDVDEARTNLAQATAELAVVEEQMAQLTAKSEQAQAQAHAHAQTFATVVLDDALEEAAQVWQQWQMAEAAVKVYGQRRAEIEPEAIPLRDAVKQAQRAMGIAMAAQDDYAARDGITN